VKNKNMPQGKSGLTRVVRYSNMERLFLAPAVETAGAFCYNVGRKGSENR
jgi:hypothetical protein